MGVAAAARHCLMESSLARGRARCCRRWAVRCGGDRRWFGRELSTHWRCSGVSNPDLVGSLSIMAVTVRIPTTMRPIAGGVSSVQVDGVTLADVLANLDKAHPGFHERLFDDNGGLRKFVNVFVADDDVRYLDGVDTKVPDGETVSIIPAVAGG